MERKCIYTREDLNMLKERARREFIIHKDRCYNAIEKAISSNYDYLIMQQLGKDLKALDMFRSQLIQFDSYIRKYYGDENED